MWIAEYIVEDNSQSRPTLLVGERSRLVDLTDDVGHTSLEAHEGGEVGLGVLVVAGERLDLSLVMLCSLTRKEPQGSVTGRFELTMGHLCENSVSDKNRPYVNLSHEPGCVAATSRMQTQMEYSTSNAIVFE